MPSASSRALASAFSASSGLQTFSSKLPDAPPKFLAFARQPARAVRGLDD